MQNKKYELIKIYKLIIQFFNYFKKEEHFIKVLIFKKCFLNKKYDQDRFLKYIKIFSRIFDCSMNEAFVFI